MGHFVRWTYCILRRFFPCDVLTVGRFVLGRFVLGRFVLERFVLGRTVLYVHHLHNFFLIVYRTVFSPAVYTIST